MSADADPVPRLLSERFRRGQPLPELALVVVELDNLTPDPTVPAHPLSEPAFARLVASIAQVGLVEPLQIWRDEQQEGLYRVYIGLQRLRALQQLRGDAEARGEQGRVWSVEVLLVHLPPAERQARAVASNLHRGMPSEAE